MNKKLSFAVRAVVALSLLFGFYALALGLAAGLLWIAYASVAYAHRIAPKLIILCLLGAFAILRGCFYLKAPPFTPPGPEIFEDQQPALFAEIRRTAQLMGAKMPAHIYWLPEVNAFVTEIGGFLGFGTRRVMGIGLGLLHVEDVSGLRAVIAHEFGHYSGGDTKLGAIVYRTRLAMVRVISSLGGGALTRLFALYARLFFRISHAISRHQELEADRSAVRVAGREAHVESLAKISRAGLAFPAFISTEVAPLCEGGVCPMDLYSGFQMSLTGSAFKSEIDRLVDEEKTSPYDTHPSHADRVAFALQLPPGAPVVRDTRPALELVTDLKYVELQIEGRLLTDLGVTKDLKRIAWTDLTRDYYAPAQAERAKAFGQRLGPVLRSGPTYGDLVLAFTKALAEKRAEELAHAIEPDLKTVPAQLIPELVPKVVSVALGALTAAALIERGGLFKTSPGSPIVVEVDGKDAAPFEVAAAAVERPDRLAEVVSLVSPPSA